MDIYSRPSTLTTATTVLGYGSLIYAHNKVFVAMGYSAVIGLTLMYLTALLILRK